ncbi:MAG TPA: aldehyde dehydrogenase [Tardiphaga sp.]
MTEMIVVEDRNQDDLSRKAGCYLYADTQLWLEDNLVHRADGPAVISPDGVQRWYIRGKEVTRDVNNFFFQNKWSVQRGLDTSEKMSLFQIKFLG